ncbi:MAG: hypothetical protein ACRERT_08575 [Pseudomonas sp.]
MTVAPPNSLIFIMDHAFGETPESMGHGLVTSTDSCVAVATLCEFDGATTVIVGADPQGVGAEILVFDGHLTVPSKQLSVCSALDEKLLSMDIPTSHVHLKVFANDATEPNFIAILVNHQPATQASTDL